MFPVTTSSTTPVAGQASKFKANKNGLYPIRLTPLQGALPANAGLIDGSVAQSLGLQPNMRYVLNILFTGMVDVKGTQYPQYQYNIVACLGASFDTMVAEKLVASMNFTFGGGSISPQAPVNSSPAEPVIESEVEFEKA